MLKINWTKSEGAELWNLYHLAKTAMAGDRPSKHDQLVWAASEYSKLHPEVSNMSAYKYMDRTANR